MLQSLHIQNYAIISNLEIRFSNKLSIITGETGAGKSILMGALGLALGNRADLSQLGDREKKLIVEAVFSVKAIESISQLLKSLEIDFEGEILLRREIGINGKSRSFVNDTPVSLGQLQEISSLLVDLHQQFDTLQLGNTDFQRKVLDAKAACIDLMKEYSAIYQQYNVVSKKVDSIKNAITKATQEKEYKLFLLKELEELNWKDQEEKQLEEELNLLSHAEQIRTGLSKISYSLSEGENPILSNLKGMQSVLQSLSSFHQDLVPMSNRLGSAYVELKDLSGDLSFLLDKVVVDESRMDQISDRLSKSQRLVKKHGLFSADELVEIRKQLSADVSGFENIQEELVVFEKERAVLFESATKIALEIHQKRETQIPILVSETKDLLFRIGMPNAILKVESKDVALCSTGIDQISFLFDANKSGNFEPLQKVASGGELSRLMLVLKSLVANSLEMPTLIFDEIDSGISGEAARQVGILMGELASSHQVISITHQPQIAAKADHHLYVYKQEFNGVVNTDVKLLTKDESVLAIAKMLAGENPSDAALANAREMMR
jgi:DNA repair protein RecN (Recombination protein N)